MAQSKQHRRPRSIPTLMAAGLVIGSGLLGPAVAADPREILEQAKQPPNQTGVQAQMEMKEYFRKPKQGGVFVIAHRGVHDTIPENSLPAYQKAIELGCDFVEIDVRSTKDGKLVCIHNATIDAYVKNATGKVRTLTLAELKSLDIGERMGVKWKHTRIPTLEEAVRLCRGRIGIYLDLKEPLVPEVVQLIQQHEMERDSVWYIPARFMGAIKELTRICPECLPMPDPGPEENIPKVVEQSRPRVLATDMGELSESFVTTTHKHGAMVFVDEREGTVKEWKKILSWRADGIQTDHPEALIGFLKRDRSP